MVEYEDNDVYDYYDAYEEGGSVPSVEYEQGLENKMYEDALLGFILTQPERMLDVVEILPDASFFADPTNRAAYTIFCDLFSRDAFPSDPALTIKELYTGGNKGQYKKHFTTMSEAERYVLHLLDAPISSKFNPNLYREYAERIKWAHDTLAIKNMAMALLSDVDKVPFNEREEFISAAETKFGDITMSVHDKEGLVHISDITDSVRTTIENLHKGIAPTAGVKTGIGSLDRMIGGFNPGEVIVLAGRPATGKSCLVKAQIHTIKGCKTIGELIPNKDWVFNRFGQPVKVTGYFPQGKRHVYKVVLSDGREVLCDKEHIWATCYLGKHGDEPAWRIRNLTVAEMLEQGIHYVRPHEKDNATHRNRARFCIPMNEAVEYPERDLPVHPYVMGLLLGDGCKDPNGDLLLSSRPNDEETVKRVAELLGAGQYKKQPRCWTWFFYKEPFDPSETNPIRLNIKDSVPQYEELLKQTYGTDKHIPDEYKYSSIEQRFELLRGLMDSEGSIDDDYRATVRYSTDSETLFADVRELLFSLGISSTIRQANRRVRNQLLNGKDTSRKFIDRCIEITCQNADKPRLFKPGRKKAIAEKWTGRVARKDYTRVQITDIIDMGYEEEMACIYVEDPHANPELREEFDSIIGETTAENHPDEHIFLVGDYVPTHNTALSLQLAYNIASRPNDVDGKRNAVLMFSLEMMEDQLVNRMIALMGRVNTDMFNKEYQRLIQGYYRETYNESMENRMKEKLETQYWRSLIALKHLDMLPFYSTTTSGLSVNAIKSMIMQKQREIEKKGQKLGLVIIDYLQLMTPGLAKANASRTEEVGDMSRRVKVMAKEFNVPILLLAQLNRDAEVNEKPQLKNLRESGSIEQDADKVLFIYNPNALKTAADFNDIQDERARYEAVNKEMMKEFISVAKNRQGNSGDCEVIFDKGFQTFVSQSDVYMGNGETFDEFAEKYYYKTRSCDDIFWPIQDGDMIPELLQYRQPQVQELPWLKSDGSLQLNKNEAAKGTMRVATSKPAAPQPKKTETFLGVEDKEAPKEPPVIDDLETDFGELDDEELEELTAAAESSDEIGANPMNGAEFAFEDDDDELDLDLLDEIKGELGAD